MIPSSTTNDAPVRVIGIPRGLLSYRYGILWQVFFEELGLVVVGSPETDRDILEVGESLSGDECCLAAKAYMGHVAALVGQCDAVFVPSYGSWTPRTGFCTKFQGLPDVVRNTFRDQSVRILSVEVDDITKEKEVAKSFIELGVQLGASPKEAKAAWKKATKAFENNRNRKAEAQKALLKNRTPEDKAQSPVILLAAHPYLGHDHYLCGAVVDSLEELGATVIFADETDPKTTYKASFDFSKTLPWVVNRELVGSILLLRDQVDGIVLVSAFPCGPDSMTDDAIMRYIEGTPILNLLIDAQSGTAGVETRIESFIDILRFNSMGGYIHD